MDTKPSNWQVTLPIKDLMTLLTFAEDVERIEKENKQLRQELEGLRNMFSEVCQQFGDIEEGTQEKISPSHLLTRRRHYDIAPLVPGVKI